MLPHMKMMTLMICIINPVMSQQGLFGFIGQQVDQGLKQFHDNQLVPGLQNIHNHHVKHRPILGSVVNLVGGIVKQHHDKFTTSTTTTTTTTTTEEPTEEPIYEPRPDQRCAGRNYGSRRCCTPEEPCDEGEGDCDGPGDGGYHDGHEGCKGDLVCGSNNCLKFGLYYHEKDDCCEKP